MNMLVHEPDTRTVDEPLPLLERCALHVRIAITPDELHQHGMSYAALSRRIADIVARNLASGRARRVMNTGPLDAYIQRVIACFLAEHHRLDRLASCDEAAWRRLFEQLAGRAYHMLLRLDVPPPRANVEAGDFAQEACELIFSNVFPYDVVFDAWATVILRRQINKRYKVSRDVMDRYQHRQSLDRPEPDRAATLIEGVSLHELLSDKAGDSPAAAFESLAVQEWLLQGIAHLRRTQRQVIMDTFFNGLSDEEIAHRLGRTRQAVYNLRHRALRHLGQILGGER